MVDLDKSILALHEIACANKQNYYTDPDSGLLVLTAYYLTERGYCCTQGCRHCPYPKDDPGNPEKLL